MEEDLRALLTGDTALTALVSTRIYWSAIPQNATDPAVVMYLISGGHLYHMQGVSGLTGNRVQIDVRAVSQTSAWAVSRAIKDRLSGFRGGQGDTEFAGIFLDSERQGSETPKNVTYYTASMDFEVWWKPS